MPRSPFPSPVPTFLPPPIYSQVRARAFSSPSAFLGILLRGTEIVWELTMFFLSLSSPRTPRLPFPSFLSSQVRARAFSSPSAFLGILLRGMEIVWELTMFFLSLSYDKLVGLDERNVPYQPSSSFL
ncbi:unnamed protein product, partial [Closterium sp. Naga37s-1]